MDGLYVVQENKNPMKRLIVVTIGAVLLNGPACFALPGSLTIDTVVGEVVKVVDAPKETAAAGGLIVHLQNAEGIEREKAVDVFRAIRKSGYNPEKKTLRKNEVVLIVEPDQRENLKIGGRIRISKYVLLTSDVGPWIVGPGKCGSLKPEEAQQRRELRIEP